jgi:hypothetical protein
MARRKQIGRRVEGWKAKSWFKVYAPEVFDKAYLGDTVANEPDKVYGRVMQTTLGEISQDYSKQNIKMRFKITNVAGDAAYTDFVGHEVTKDYLRAMVKRRASRIDSILLLTTSDGKKTPCNGDLLYHQPCGCKPAACNQKRTDRVSYRQIEGTDLLPVRKGHGLRRDLARCLQEHKEDPPGTPCRTDQIEGNRGIGFHRLIT